MKEINKIKLITDIAKDVGGQLLLHIQKSDKDFVKIKDELVVLQEELEDGKIELRDKIKQAIQAIEDIELLEPQKGEKGDKGDTGKKGDKGDIGKTGETGMSGLDGVDGLNGNPGEKGEVGDKGDIGSIPKHEWKGTALRFEESEGAWGKWVNLQGNNGIGSIIGGGRSIRVSNSGREIGLQVKQLNFGTGLVVTGNNDLVTINSTGISKPEADLRYLKLDCSNDPLTGELELPSLQFTDSGRMYHSGTDLILDTATDSRLLFKLKGFDKMEFGGADIANSMSLKISGTTIADLPAGIESMDVSYFFQSQTKTFETGDITTQRGWVFNTGNVAFDAPSTITNLTTFQIDKAITPAANATVINSRVAQFGGSLSLGATTSGMTYSVLDVPDHTVVVTGSTNVTSANSFSAQTLGQISMYNISAMVFDTASTLYIKGAPIASGSLLITNPYSIFVDDGLARFDGGIIFNDNVDLLFGTSSDVSHRWDTTDANANMLKTDFPAGSSVNVPVHAMGIGIKDVDLALFNGTINPTLAIFKRDRSKYQYFGWNDTLNTGTFTSSGNLALLTGVDQIKLQSTAPIANIRMLVRATTGRQSSVEFGEGNVSALFFRHDGLKDWAILAVSTLNGRTLGIIDTNNRDIDPLIPVQDNPLQYVGSTLSPNTDRGETSGWTYKGLRCGNIDNADFSSSTFGMTSDRATYDYTISAVNAYASATTNIDGGNLILKAGNKATGGQDGKVKVDNHLFEIQSTDVLKTLAMNR
jgi:hypothetical protein